MNKTESTDVYNGDINISDIISYIRANIRYIKESELLEKDYVAGFVDAMEGIEKYINKRSNENGTKEYR
ncbi:MAG: hypothetical protein AABY32_01380 [Nanoarchaeota archaeon]